MTAKIDSRKIEAALAPAVPGLLDALSTKLSSVRRLFAYLKPYRARMGVALLASLLGSAFGLVFPKLVVELLESIAAMRDLHTLNLFAGALVGVFFLQTSFNALESYLLAFVGERVVFDLRTSLYGHLQTLSLEFFIQRRVGDLISRISNDVTQMRAVLTSNMALVFSQAATLVGALAFMFSMNARLTLLIVAMAPLLIFVAAFFARRIEKASAGAQDKLAHSTVVAEEGLQGIYAVKSLGKEQYETRRYVQAMEEGLGASLEVARHNTLFNGFIGFFALCSIVAVIWYGGREVIAGRLTLGKITGFLIYGILIAQTLGQLANVFGQLSAALGGVRRVFELLDAHPTVRDAPGAAELASCRGEITIRSASFGYEGARLATDDVSLDVQPGEIVALVGPSGAGKTTLFNLILRLYDPRSGSVSIDGRDLRSLTQRSFRAHIAIVPQETRLFGGTIRENILYGCSGATESEVITAARDANAHDFVMELPNGYDTLVGERGGNLSGGQRQRIAIARAILRKPKILLLDEATSSLDSESEELVQDALVRLMKDRRTTLVIAHRLSTIRAAHRIAVLDRGRLVELGTHDELLARNGLYARLYALQFRPSA